MSAGPLRRKALLATGLVRPKKRPKGTSAATVRGPESVAAAEVARNATELGRPVPLAPEEVGEVVALRDGDFETYFSKLFSG